MNHHYPDCQGGPDCDCDEREQFDVHRFVRLEVDVIEIRRYTKIVSMPQEYANRVLGKLWANDKKAGLSEADCVAACMETPGQITREVRENEIDTIDVLDFYEPNAESSHLRDNTYPIEL